MDEHLGYLVFCSIINTQLLERFPDKTCTELADIVKINWEKLSAVEKDYYIQIGKKY